MLKYDWPGNVRELENTIERAVILTRNDSIGLDVLPGYTPNHVDLSSEESIRDIEKRHIVNILEESGGNCSRAAGILGISRVTLYNKIKTYQISVNRKRR